MSSSFLMGLFLQLSIAGSLSQAAYLITIGSGSPGFYPFVFLIYGPLIFIINTLFLRKERKLSAIAALNVSAGACALAAAILICGHYSFWSILCSVLSIIFLTYQGVNLNIKEPTLRSSTLSVECAVLVTIIFAALVSFLNADPVWIFPGVLGLACGIISLILKRIGRIPGLRDIILIAGILIIAFAIALLFVIFAAAPAGNGLIYLGSLLVQGAKQIGRLIEYFFLWLSSFTREGSSAPVEIETMSTPSDTDSEEILQEGPYGLIAIIAAAIIAVIIIIFIVRYLRRHRFSSVTRLSRVSVKVDGSRPALKDAIKRLIAKLKLNRAKRKYLKAHADTPLGIYYRLELKFSHGKNRKAAGESPREYILRLNSLYKSSDSYNPDNDKIFEHLADMVDVEMYGYASESGTGFPEAKLLNEIIREIK